MEELSKISEYSSLVKQKCDHTHMATKPPGITGYIETFVTTALILLIE